MDAQQAITLTDSAAKRIIELFHAENDPDLKLRLFISGGGCSGFQYNFRFESTVNEDDTQIQKNGAVLLIDSASYPYLAGAEIDYVENLAGAQFVINNPNATGKCGCGSSFSA